ncbi:purine-nucleoside phosphorylase [Prosthecobacter fusiformis]|uniref:purine-nucleoside phosphorylase n=1 Tax=Prosthecobacter fusiformis TaxID=48464 RepID=A0A4R7RR25_9BACT|nr:purine-nucleoside phosphorylase [Prosthecobacter fusiformis]TDU67156.1 purine-nucleoside phosphorylase [Prosthecobacter fusiformis]
MSITRLHEASPETAIVLGSGLGGVAEALGIEAEVSYSDIPGLSASTVPGHAGRFVLSRVNEKPVLIAQGRRHLYEGLSAYEVTAGIRFMSTLGVRRIVLTNAAGAINASFAVGDLMLITDHLNLLGTTPLLGGPHFHDMSEVYSQAWRTEFLRAAEKLVLPLHQGVYAATLGPQYETPAEIRMMRTLGADAVGMSTVPEAIQARALGMEVAGISMLTNWAAGLKAQTLHHAEVVSVGQAASTNLAALLKSVL